MLILRNRRYTLSLNLMAKLKIIKYLFSQRISQAELSKFRGVLISLSHNDDLTHNHEGDGFRYIYPKIQYKIIDGKAAVIGINEGVALLRNIFQDKESFSGYLGNRPVEFNIMSTEEIFSEISITDKMHTYKISRWQPLNKRNLAEFNHADGLAEKVMLMERILTGNILSCAKGLDEYFSQRINCKILDIDYEGNKAYKGIELLNFSATFKTNVMIPQWLGLGKSVSLNHGTVISL